MPGLADDDMADLKELIIKELEKMHIAKDHGDLHLVKVRCKTANKMIDVLFGDHHLPSWMEKVSKYHRKVE